MSNVRTSIHVLLIIFFSAGMTGCGQNGKDGAQIEKRERILEHFLATFHSNVPGEKPVEHPIWESWLKRTGELPPDFDQLATNAFPPDLLKFQDGTPVTNPEEWLERKKEIRGILDYYMLGNWPPPPEKVAIKYQESKADENEEFTKQNAQIFFAPSSNAVEFAEEAYRYLPRLEPNNRVDRCDHDVAVLNVELYIPKGEGPFPAIITTTGFLPTLERDLPRIMRGNILVRYNMLDPDYIPAVYVDYDCNQLEWWAFAAGRCVDLLYSRNDVDTSKIAMVGSSREAKAALLATLMDSRVDILVTNQPGAGAGTFNLWRYIGEKYGGEHLEYCSRQFQYWNKPRMRFFAGRENKMPFDSHFLQALVAPRPVLLGTGERSHVGQPWGDQQCYLALKEVYKLLGNEQNIALNVAPGGHDYTPYVINNELDWLDMQFGRKPFTFKEDLIYTYTFNEWKDITGAELKEDEFPGRDMNDILKKTNGETIIDQSGWEEKAENIVDRIKWVIGDLPAYQEIEKIDMNNTRVFKDNLMKAEIEVDEKLVAYMTYPVEKTSKIPVVIYLHAYLDAGGHEWARYYGYRTSVGERMAQNGFLAIEFDQFGYGSRNRDSGIGFYKEHPEVSAIGVMIQDVRKIIDAVSLLEWVDKDNIMVAGYSLGGMVGLYAAVFEPRIKAVASTCGFGSMRLDAHGNQTEGIRRYSHLRPTIPRLGLFLGNEKRIPYDFHEILSLIAPRSVFVLAPQLDQDWFHEDVEICYQEATKIFDLYGKRDHIVFNSPNDFNRYPPKYQNMVNEWLKSRVE